MLPFLNIIRIVEVRDCIYGVLIYTRNSFIVIRNLLNKKRANKNNMKG